MYVLLRVQKGGIGASERQDSSGVTNRRVGNVSAGCRNRGLAGCDGNGFRLGLRVYSGALRRNLVDWGS